MDETKIILEKLDDIKLRIDNIEKDIKYLKNGNDNMNNHISFVENVYDNIKSPFYYIINKVNRIQKLPEKEMIEFNNKSNK